jgi:hypothetical protein
MPSAGGDNPGPSPGLAGTLGAAPQASPQQAPGNALGGPQQPQKPPPSMETLVDAAHKTGYVNSMLKELLSEPDLSSRTIIDSVGHLVAENIMNPFDAAQYLKDLPTDPVMIRQWVAQHYTNSAQSLHNVAAMIHMAGAAQRQGQPQPQMMQPQAPPNMMQGNGGPQPQ